jgi:hypothetical protein
MDFATLKYWTDAVAQYEGGTAEVARRDPQSGPEGESSES